MGTEQNLSDKKLLKSHFICSQFVVYSAFRLTFTTRNAEDRTIKKAIELDLGLGILLDSFFLSLDPFHVNFSLRNERMEKVNEILHDMFKQFRTAFGIQFPLLANIPGPS